jgi:carbohydrate kinase (thermoresistant glucokinase family)
MRRPSHSRIDTVAVLVVMGVSSSGNTTVATELSRRLHWELADADTFHSAANVHKMASGIPLTDEDRWRWLAAIAAWIDGVRAAGRHGIIACSALKRSYRDLLIGDRSDVRLVYLKGDFDLVARRMKQRHGHYMPAELLQSQFDTLEEPTQDEHPIVVSIDTEPSSIAAEIIDQLQLSTPAA